MLRVYNRFIDYICKAIQYFVAVLIMAAIAISFIEVVRRYFFNQVFVWSDEFVRFCLIYVGLVGGAAAYRYGQLVCFDSLLNKLKEGPRFVCAILSDLISLALLVFCFVLSIQTITAPSVTSALSTGMKIPMVVPYLAFVIGFFLMILFCVGDIANRITNRKHPDAAVKED